MTRTSEQQAPAPVTKWINEVLSPKLPAAYAIPPWCHAPADKTQPAHSAILCVILAAKNAGDIWADSALGEISLIMGKNYVFVRTAALESLRHEIQEKL